MIKPSLINPTCGYVASTRKEAVATGCTRFVSQVPCKHGHTGLRWVSGHCVSCANERNRVVEQRKQLNPSRMLDIDHLLEARAEEALMDNYYHMEF